MILRLAHVKRRVIPTCRGLDFDEIRHIRDASPDLRIKISLVDEQARQLTVSIMIGDVCCLSSEPGLHLGVVRVAGDVAADGALPIRGGEVRQPWVQTGQKLEDLIELLSMTRERS